jgi:hypothetical protein
MTIKLSSRYKQLYLFPLSVLCSYFILPFDDIIM